jgi:thymidylate synthase ThyX
MSRHRRIYLLDPQKYAPETIAVTFAKTSRSPQSFDEIANELNDTKTAEFNEKWVVGYGHSSVAEHAILHVAIENISRLAIETLESNRLASYTEKSSRYQTWGVEDFYVPPELTESDLRDEYINTCKTLFQAYKDSIPIVNLVLQRQQPRLPSETESAWERKLRTQTIDICRFLLPTCAMANVGMTINARALEHALTKMISHPLLEVQQIGLEIKRVSQTEIPTLVKYADHNTYLEETQRLLSVESESIQGEATSDWCRLVYFDRDFEDHIFAAALYKHNTLSYAQVLDHVKLLSRQQKTKLANILLANLTSHDIPLRELEHSSFTFDLILDQGAYNEVKRHRMMTQTPQPLTHHLGYALPKTLVLAGLENIYRQSMTLAREVYTHLYRYNPHIAPYVIPNAFNRRVLLTFNLRTAFHFLNLRSSSNAHFSMRRVAHRMVELIRDCSPLLAGYMNIPKDETWRSIEAEYFSQTVTF